MNITIRNYKNSDYEQVALNLKEAEERIKRFGSKAMSGTIKGNNPELEKYYIDLGYELAPQMNRYVLKKF